MGCTKALFDAADFSGTCAGGGLKIGDDIGTVAAAATAVTVAPSSALVEIVD